MASCKTDQDMGEQDGALAPGDAMAEEHSRGEEEHRDTPNAQKRKRKRKKKKGKGATNQDDVVLSTDESIKDLSKGVADMKLGGKGSDVNEKSKTAGQEGGIKNRHEVGITQPSTPNRDQHDRGTNTEQSGGKHRRHRNRRKKKHTGSEDDERQQVDGALLTTPQKKNDSFGQTPNKGGTPGKNSSPRKYKCYEKYWSLESVSDGLKRGELLKGALRISKRNFEMAWVSVAGQKRDVYLEGVLARNRALDGDIVALNISPRNKWKLMKHEYDAHGASHEGNKTPSKGGTTPHTPESSKNKQRKNEEIPDAYLQQTAHVVYIIEKKHTRAASGNLKPFQYNQGDVPDGLFSPSDSRLPRMRIPHAKCPLGFFDRPQDFASTLFVGRITEWPENAPMDNFFATGEISRSLGEAGEIEPETQGIFFEYGIDPGPFPDEALDCLPKETPWSIPETEFAHRRDFRDECVFTIDPLTARDLDDALHCKRLSDGLIEVGVHIADVSFFVKTGTPLDDIAQERATSTYMVQTVVPMLPRRLCEELCSLNPDEDRLTFSVVWIMTDQGEIKSDWKGRGIIRSRVKMAYEHAQEMIDKPNKKWSDSELPPIAEGTDVSEIVKRVNLLAKIARQLRRNRFENGALRLDQVKLQFDLDKETGMPIGYHVYQQRESNKLIEEFMLLANMTVAHHIYKAFPDMALLRRHPKPHEKQMEDLLELCRNLGIKYNANSSKSIQVSLAQFPSGSAQHEILVQLTMKPMKNALYFCAGTVEEEEYGHYALSVPLYTHFTSPIRRYADVIVHRLLAASLELAEPLDKDAVDVDSIAGHCNDCKLAAKTAGELSSELFFAIFVRECGPLEEDGYVLGIMDMSFDVFVPALGVTKRIYCKFCPGVKRYVPYDRKEQVQPEITLVWATGTEKKPGKDVKQVLHIFSKVHVILTTESTNGEKSKHVKVYARLRPPQGAADDGEEDLPADEEHVNGDEEPLAETTPNATGDEDDVIVESEEEMVPEGDRAGVDDVIVETESDEDLKAQENAA